MYWMENCNLKRKRTEGDTRLLSIDQSDDSILPWETKHQWHSQMPCARQLVALLPFLLNPELA